MAGAVKLKVDANDLYKKTGMKIVEHYGSLYSGLEAAAKRGPEALHEAGVTKRASKVLATIAKDKIVVKGVTVQGELEMTSRGPRGIEDIKDTLSEARIVAIEDDAEANLYSLGSPKYRIEITAEDYKKVNEIVLQDPNVDAVVSIFVEPVMVNAFEVIESVNSIKSEKPIYQVCMPLPEFWSKYSSYSTY